MAFRDRQGLKETARQRLLTAAYDPQKLILVFVGASAAVMLLVTGLNFLLNQQIAGTGGLGGVGTRAMLQTAMEMLQLAASLVTPFWTMGYLACVLRIVRGERFDLTDLLTGFRHFGPVLRLTLLYSGYFLMLAFLCFYPSMLVFSMTPFAAPLMEIMEPLVQTGADIVPDDATLAAATDAMMPMMILYVLVFLAVAAPHFYRFRLAYFALLDDPKAGALAALGRSTLMMRGKRLDLLKLDVSFWWFYVLDGLTVALCYGDAILMWLGISLPIASDGAYFLFYVLYLAAQLGLYVWARNRVECTYAVGYDALCRGETEIQ